MKKSSLSFASQILILSTGILFTFCSKPNEIDKVTLLGKASINAEDTFKYPSKRVGDAHGGNAYWKVDSAYIYGIDYIFQIPDSVVNKNIRVKLDSWARLYDLGHDQKYALSLEDGKGKVIHWSEVNYRSYITETNKWIHVIDSVTIPGNLVNMPGLIIKTYSFNPDGKASLDVDDVELTFSKVETVVVD